MPNNLSFNCVQPEDGQILCSDKSLFARQQAERHSNFDVNLVDVDPEGGTWGFGRQCVFKIPRFADLLGPVDLVVEVPTPVRDDTYTGHSKITSAFVESLGYAMIESAELFLGNNLVETLHGETLNIQNELFRSNADRLHPQILNTGGPAIPLAQQSAVLYLGAAGTVPGLYTLASGGTDLLASLGPGSLWAYNDLDDVADNNQLHLVCESYTALGEAPGGAGGATPNILDVRPGDVITVKNVGGTLTFSLFAVDLSDTQVKTRIPVRLSTEQQTPKWSTLHSTLPNGTPNKMGYSNTEANARIIKSGTKYIMSAKRLIVSLPFFFTQKPCDYLPMNALSVSSDISIRLRLRSAQELVLYKYKTEDIGKDLSTAETLPTAAHIKFNDFTANSVLRCHQVYLTKPEATLVESMNHTRMLNLWTPPGVCSEIIKLTCAPVRPDGKPSYTLSGSVAAQNHRKVILQLGVFQRPIKELYLTIRRVADFAPRQAQPTEFEPVYGDDALGVKTNVAGRNYFGYQGANRVTNQDSWCNSIIHAHGATASWVNLKAVRLVVNNRGLHDCKQLETISETDATKYEVKNGGAITREYLTDRIMTMTHTNTSTDYARAVDKHVDVSENESSHDLQMLAGSLDRKDIFAIPLNALQPEAFNPSGHLNFSAIKHAQLELDVEAWSNGATEKGEEYQFDVYAQYINWLEFNSSNTPLRAGVLFAD